MQPKLKLGLSLWLSGMVGATALTLFVVPQLLSGKTLSIPLPVLLFISLIQSAIFVGLAVGVGVVFTPKVALAAPSLTAAIEGQPVWPSLRKQLIPGLAGGLAGGIFVGLLLQHAPASFQALTPPLAIRVLYGGITEELLLRWGAMSLLLWLMWRAFQADSNAPRLTLVWASIVISAVLFAAAHLPAVSVLSGSLTQETVSFVLAGNTAFGVLAGYLFWRYGLECAVICHALAHLFAYAMNG